MVARLSQFLNRRGGLVCPSLWAVGLSAVLGGASSAALDIQGVQIASVDQPRINAAITLVGSPTSPLTAGDPPFTTFNIQAFFDTGASGVLVSKETADGLGLPLASGVVFEDVGVGGIDAFNVSQDVRIHLADFIAPLGSGGGIDDPAQFTSTYSTTFGPLRTQVAQQNSGTFVGGLDVFGMPLFQGKYVTMDPRRLNNGELELIETKVYDAAAKPAGDPAAHFHIQTRYGDFLRFTQTTGGAGPDLAPNPFIGSDPTASIGGTGGSAPGIDVGFNGLSATGNWLFDTGAQASIISEQQAALLGVTYDPATVGTANPTLLGAPLADQFQLTIGGVGGTRIVAGFLLDTFALPTVEGRPIIYHQAPVLVIDITVQDIVTLDTVTLDGIFGMNFLFPSFNPSSFEIVGGAFDFITFDQTTGLIGLTLRELPGDLNDDGFVSQPDLDLVLLNWGDTVTPGDASLGDGSGDGLVAQADLDLVLLNWGLGTPPSSIAAIPEPATAGLMVLGGFALLRRRRGL